MVFHRETPFLRPAIESVLRQTFRDLELVLVDNGTGLREEALGVLGADPRLRWVRLARNEGIPGGHNAGVQAARGEFIALLDHDDLALPQRLERQVAALRAEPGLGLVSSLAERIDEAGRVIEREFALVEAGEHFAYTQYAAPVVTPAFTGRREVFAGLPYRSEFRFSADFDFLARAAERWPMKAVPEVLLRYRWHGGQATQTHAREIERHRCVIRLLTARRRAERAEDLAGAMSELNRPEESASESCRRTAARCVAEGFYVLAAYHARRSFVLERNAAAARAAVSLFARAIVAARNGVERARVARMFFHGPVKALKLQPR